MLTVLDRKWREHLYEMDYLKEGIGLRAMAQRDPLIEYQREGFDMFNAMLDALKEESVGFLFNLQVEQSEPAPPSDAAAVPASVGVAAANAQARHEQQQKSRPTPPPPPEKNVPPALRGKGLGDATPQRLNYSGPAEGGGVNSRREGGDAEGGGQSGSRRDRRAAARDQVKKGKKGPRR